MGCAYSTLWRDVQRNAPTRDAIDGPRDEAQSGQWRDIHLRRLSKRMGGHKHKRRTTGKGHSKPNKPRRQCKKTATQGDVMQKYALHRGQNHDTHAMGVAHGTTSSASCRAEMEDN